MDNYLYPLMTTRCSRCLQLHTLAIVTRRCGRVEFGLSPNLTLCYACALAAMPPAQREERRLYYRSLFLKTNNGPSIPRSLDRRLPFRPKSKTIRKVAKWLKNLKRRTLAERTVGP